MVKRLGPNECLVELPVHRKARQDHPELPETLQARAVRYQRRGFRPQTLLTSLLDPTVYPAAEIVDKFLALTTETLGAERARDVVRLVEQVETLKDVRDLTALLFPAP